MGTFLNISFHWEVVAVFNQVSKLSAAVAVTFLPLIMSTLVYVLRAPLCCWVVRPTGYLTGYLTGHAGQRVAER